MLKMTDENGRVIEKGKPVAFGIPKRRKGADRVFSRRN
jgi:hypothetical protein